MLNPQGPGAARLAELWWVMLAFGTAVFGLVLVLLGAGLLRRRRGNEATPPDSRSHDTGRNWVMWGGIALPLVATAELRTADPGVSAILKSGAVARLTPLSVDCAERIVAIRSSNAFV